MDGIRSRRTEPTLGALMDFCTLNPPGSCNTAVSDVPSRSRTGSLGFRNVATVGWSCRANNTSTFALEGPIGLAREGRSEPADLPAQAYAVIIAVRSGTTYATISAAGKKTRLKRRYRKKLCPCEPSSHAEWLAASCRRQRVHPVRGMRLRK